MDLNPRDRIGISKKAEIQLKKGKKYIKTSIFKWKPDYTSAIPSFQEAATLFFKIENYPSAFIAYENLATCNLKINDLYGAASAYEKMAQISFSQTNSAERALALLQKASNLLKVAGVTHKAQKMIWDFGKSLKKHSSTVPSPDDASLTLQREVYKSLFSEIFSEENYLYGSDLIGEYISILIDSEMYKEAIEAEEQHIDYLNTSHSPYEHLKTRAYLSIVSICVIMGDNFVFDEKLQQMRRGIERPASSDEYRAAQSIVDAVNDRDRDAFMKALKKPIFNHIETNIAKKLRKVQIIAPEGEERKQQQTVYDIEKYEESKGVLEPTDQDNPYGGMLK
jgi:gamma-soluble NSF attachment protein